MIYKSWFYKLFITYNYDKCVCQCVWNNDTVFKRPRFKPVGTVTFVIIVPLDIWQVSKLCRSNFDKNGVPERSISRSWRNVISSYFRRREPRKSVEKREIATTSTERFCMCDRCDLGRSQTLLSTHLSGGMRDAASDERLEWTLIRHWA